MRTSPQAIKPSNRVRQYRRFAGPSKHQVCTSQSNLVKRMADTVRPRRTGRCKNIRTPPQAKHHTRTTTSCCGHKTGNPKRRHPTWAIRVNVVKLLRKCCHSTNRRTNTCPSTRSLFVRLQCLRGDPSMTRRLLHNSMSKYLVPIPAAHLLSR